MSPLQPAALSSLVDDRVGVIGELAEVPIDPGDPEFFHFAAQACDTSAFVQQANFASTGGAATTRQGAATKAVGEAIERYCAAMYDIEKLPLAAASEARFECVDPRSFALFSEEQYAEPGFPWVPFEPDTPVRWTPAREAGNWNEVYVPAAVVFIPYLFYQGTGDAPILQPISTGLACHTSFAAAALAALCEVIERDHFTITWQAMLALPQLRVETLSDSNYDLVERFERTGAEVLILDATLDLGLPVVFSALLSDQHEAPALIAAAACDPSAEVAIRKSLEELAHTRRYAQQVRSRLGTLPPEPGHSNVVDQLTHLQFWGDARNRPLCDFLRRSRVRRAFAEIVSPGQSDSVADLRLACERLTKAGHRVFFADVTTGDVRDLGYRVVRAVVPGLHPLFMGHQIRALGGERLWNVPARVNLPRAAAEGKDNPAPHPFP